MGSYTHTGNNGKVVSATFEVDQDVNSSDFQEQELVFGTEEIAYGLSGGGGFDLKIDWIGRGGASLDTETINSSDGSRISGAIPTKGYEVQVTVTDTSGASNTVTGTINAH